MAFTLRVTQGPGESEEFSFDGGEARLGRTADNDVVIKDPSSSRSHARVYEEGGRFFVEDLKSANGTRLNDAPIKAPKPLKSGDSITIGDVVLEFTAPEAETAAPSSTLDEGGEDEIDANETLLKAPKPAALARKAPPPRRAPEPEEEPDPPADDEGDGEEEEQAGAESTKNFNVPPPRALSKRTPAVPAARPSRSAAEAEPEVALSAAERARQRRELQKSGSGRAQLLWNDLPRPARLGLAVVGGAMALGLIALMVWSVIPKQVVKLEEPDELRPNGDPIAESFGLGDDVDFTRPDMKSFGFSFAAPTTIVGVLHYQARDCGKDEVSVELNGASLGTVPPDTVDVGNRQLELVLPATALKVNDPNELVFDNVGNPPAEDTWKIWNLWVEIIPVPQMSADEAARRAKDDIDRGAKAYELRNVGAMNLFNSWKNYRNAWLLLEATPDRPTELLTLARTRMREIRPELDRKCSAMIVTYQKAINMKYPDVEGARQVLRNIPEHFEKEHPCFSMARGMLRELDALDAPPE